MKAFPKHPGQSKLSNHRWQKPLGESSNLVISFSDDDSGSDSEQQGPRKECEIDSSSQAINGSKQHSSSAPTMETIRRTMSNEGKLQQKKLTISQTLTPSVPRSSIPKPRNIWSSSAEKKSRSMSSNLGSRNIGTRDGGRSKSVDLCDSKLQDLRQQIALRESELKLKTAQQSRETSSEPCKELNNVDPHNSARRRSRDVPSDLHHEPKEPDAKRKRLGLDGAGQLSRVSQEKSIEKSMLASNDSAARCSNTKDASVIDRGHHGGEIVQSKVLQGSDRTPVLNGLCEPFLANTKSGGQDGSDFPASCSLSDWMSRSRSNMASSNPKEGVSLQNIPNTLGVGSAVPSSRLDENDPSSSSKKHEIPLDDNNGASDQQDAIMKPDVFKSGNNLQAHSIQAFPCDANASKHLRLPDQGSDDMDLQSLYEYEELHDKQLEEAQQHRRKCEIEERNALKAYLKAQRALAEANAQCSYLYRKRELFSARLRSLLMDNPGLLLSSEQQGQCVPWNFLNDASEANDLIPASSDQRPEPNNGNQFGCGSNVRSADGDRRQILSPNVDGNNFGSEACSEPDASTSELLPHKNKESNNAILSRSNEPNVSSDECEGMSGFQGKKDVVGDPTMKLTVDASQETIQLEAYLRSKLVSKLQTITPLKGSEIGDNGKGRVDQHPDADTDGTQMALDKVSSAKPGKEQLPDQGSVSGHERDADTNVGVGNNGKKLASEGQSLTNDDLPCDIDEGRPDLGGFRPSASDDHGCQSTEGNRHVFLSPTLRSALYQVKDPCSVGFELVHITNKQNGNCYPHEDKTVICAEDSVTNVLVGRTDSYTCDSLIDPLWPLCMYELRGKCNNEECPWQHSGDYSKSTLQKRRSSISVGAMTGLSSNCLAQKAGEPPHVLTPPAYLVCLGTLKNDKTYHLAQNCAPCWQKIFTLSLAVSCAIQRQLPSHEPVLHGNYGRIEIRGNQNRQSLYLQNRNLAMNLQQADCADNNQVLEAALLVLNQETDKAVGMKKSLALLSRSLEAYPTCLHLWVVYLLIYYSDKNSAVDVELFSCAVKHNEGSYELWLMFINSCKTLKDQLAAYEKALSSLCRHVHDFGGDPVHASACILDVFLQMSHCFCSSGSSENVLKRIYRLTDARQDPGSLLLSDSLQCLTISDQCVFWVCCVYLVIYGKVPDVIVGKFEFEKDISSVDWPCVDITAEEKQLAYKLVEMASDSIKSHLDSASPENKAATLRVADLLALNHVKLVAAVDSFEACITVLQTYSSQYSSCLEVVLLAARVCTRKSGSVSFQGFEEALSSWPKEVAGIQCIWNQFAEFALQGGGFDAAKDIILRWYDSVRKTHRSQSGCGNSDDNDCNGEDHIDPLLMFSSSALLSKVADMDVVFGLLNLSLYWLLQKDVVKAYSALDRAIKAAREDFRHCVREHALFLLKYGSQLGKDVDFGGLLDVLKSYMVQSKNIPASEPLTRKFIQEIKESRTKRLVHDMLCPVSPDFSTVNLVLEAWFGPSLLPQKLNKIEELVDFVEAILELVPCNYPLGISACKLLLSKESVSPSTSFWASSMLVNAIYQSVPVPPEYIWVEATGLLLRLSCVEEICESFYRKALSVYPFSVNLWKSFLSQSVAVDRRKRLMEAAKEKGMSMALLLSKDRGVSVKDKGMETWHASSKEGGTEKS